MKAKINLKKTIPILTITILLISTITFIGIPTASADITGVTATANDYTAGATEVTYTIAFTTGATLAVAAPADQILITFPEGFDATGAAVDETTTTPSTSDPTIASVTETVVTLAVAADESAGAFSIVLSGIKNTETAGTTYTVSVETQDGEGGTIEAAVDSSEFTIDPAALHHFAITGCPTSCIAGKAWVDDVTVTAQDQFNNTVTEYLGTVGWGSTDPFPATLPTSPSPAFTDGELTVSGAEFTLMTGGLQVIYVNETGDATSGESIPIQVTAEFKATVSPTFVKSGESYWFEVSVANNASGLAINVVTITYPTGTNWVLNNIEAPQGWMITGANEFTATGGWDLDIGESAVFKFNMTAGTVNDDFTIDVKNVVGGTYYPEQVCSITIDKLAPTINVVHPTGDELTKGYSVGAGNKVWINATVTDNFEFTPVMYINASGFDYTIKLQEGETKAWDVCFYNVSYIQDGTLAFYINATDGAGNVGTTGDITVEIDNTPPEIIDITVYDSSGKKLPEPIPGKFYMSKEETEIYVNVTVYDPHLDITNSRVYFNTTLKYTIITSTNGTKQGPYSIETVDYIVINVTTFDTSLPEANSYNRTIEVFRDIVGPSEIGFTAVEPICGGLIIRGLYAEDLVGVLDYVIYVNGTALPTISELNLKSTTWAVNAFNSIAVLNLTAYVGDFVNITVIAYDFGLNPSDEIVLFTGIVPEGEWYAVELYKDWNLVSLPLIPNSTASADVLSLILKQGVNHVYEYDQTTDSWIIDPAKIEDGKGYWFYMDTYDVLIVSGSKMPPGGGIPPTYTLTEGWVLAGFKSTVDMEVSEYLASVRNTSYFKIIYIWDAADQVWGILNRDEAAHKLTPGQGFWILMYEEEVLVPPTA